MKTTHHSLAVLVSALLLSLGSGCADDSDPSAEGRDASTDASAGQADTEQVSDTASADAAPDTADAPEEPDATPEDTAPDAVLVDVASDTAGAEDAPTDATSEDAAEDTSPKDANAEDATSEDTTPQEDTDVADSTLEDTTPEDADVADTTPEDADATPEDADAAPEDAEATPDTAPEDTSAADTAPDAIEDSSPEDTTPDVAPDTSEDSALADTSPEDVDGDAVDAEPDACVPACEGRVCGDNGCGDVCGVCADDEACVEGGCEGLYPGLPRVHNLSTAPPERVRALIGEAIAGLGFDGPSGPREEDRIVVGGHYLAWIDETGFYGKMNGLWWLNDAAGAALDFTTRDTLGRPVSLFVPGEDGLGRWPAGYPGAEHLEFPSRTPEPNDDPACSQRDWCNQYALNEANDITDPDIPWWGACNNAGRMSWEEAVEPIEVTPLEGGGLRLVYEGRLVKQADGDGTWDGDACHADWLFADGVRRPVFLQVGYELHPDQPWFDRVMRFRNPEGNPPFEGPMSLIGGFVISDWPEPHYPKALPRFVRPIDRSIDDPYHGLVLAPQTWNGWPSDPIGRDVVFGWVGQPFALSGFDDFVTGWTARMDHLGPSDNDDSGFCLCEVHGGLEIGGGLLHGDISLPIGPGARSIEARRRLRMGGEGWRGVTRRVYEAEAGLSHGPGRAEAEGWAAATGDHEAGHMLYGPYASDWGDGPVQVVFDVLVDNTTATDDDIVTLDLFDSTAGEIVAIRRLTRRDFARPWAYQPFALEANLAGRGGHVMESRVYWHDLSYVRVDKVTVLGLD